MSYFLSDWQRIFPCFALARSYLFRTIYEYAINCCLINCGMLSVVSWTRRSNNAGKGRQSTSVTNNTPLISLQTRYIEPMLSWCWPSVVDDGPTSTQHWLNVSCLLGSQFVHILMIHWLVSGFEWSQPSNHDTLTQCWFRVSPTSETLGQH